MEFCHLHVHNEYSYLDGFGSAKKYISRAKKIGQKYIALTNHGNVDGLIQWQKECDKQKIHPVLGAELYIVPDRNIKQKGEKRGHITILVKDQSGWKNLCSLLTEANLTGFYYRPRIDYSLLLSHDLSGLIILTACAGSFLLLSGAEEFFARLTSKAEVYFEIMPHKIEAQKVVHDCIKILSRKFNNVNFVATNDCHYIEKDEVEAQEMLLAINSRAKWSDPNRWTFGFGGLHLRSSKEMVEGFASQNHWSGEIVSEAIENTIKIAEKCKNFRIKKQDISLPLVSGIAPEDEFEILTKICERGYKKRYGNETFKKEYRKRYEQELSLIDKKGFIRYFLIVHNLINWAKENGIMIGPGRGCFVKDSVVQTFYHNQIQKKKIQDVVINKDKVICHDNTKNKVIDKMEYDVDEDIIEIQVEDGRIIECTLDHKIMTDRGWVEAQNLTETDRILDWSKK